MVATRDRVLLPRAEAFHRPGRRVMGDGVGDLRGKRVAFVDNGRPNADVVMNSLQELMGAKYDVEPVMVSKSRLGLRYNEPLPNALFQDLLRQVDAAVSGLGS